jgi:signal transduction histidine kinase/CheY-like chemotaxis protein
MAAHPPTDLDDVFLAGGEMGARMRAYPWETTPLGRVEQWPQSLRTAVSICLASRFPILLWWGPKLVMLYNDAYRPLLGTSKHPTALGQVGTECWPEIWDIIGPMLHGVLERGEATWSDDQLLTLDRNGYLEECYFTFSYSPIRDESGGIGGVFTAVTETTQRVVGERRLETLRALAEVSSGSEDARGACEAAADVLALDRADVPFALVYLLDDAATTAALTATSGIEPGDPLAPRTIEVDDARAPWPLSEVVRRGAPEEVVDLAVATGTRGGDGGPVSDRGVVLPILHAGMERPAGVLVVGTSPLRALDDDYRSFLDLVAGHIAGAIANALAREAERARVEALREVDRAKTSFLTNVSHEFRTPLTLLLGPLADALDDVEAPLPATQRERVDTAHRSALRLLKLVNTLLEFSRIEAGRVAVQHEPTDLAAYTTDLAAVFRSAVERAGLALVVDCPPLARLALVDRSMWERIVMNLLSNALKFTERGTINVTLHDRGDDVELTVRDTGIGIPADELPRLFERFRRVRTPGARTFEGTGIGLALVKELAEIHGGSVTVRSTLGAGSTFTVRVPYGDTTATTGAPAVAVEGLDASTYAAEAEAWRPTPDRRVSTGAPVDGYILFVDDNADMRDYVTRLLERHWPTRAAADARTALDVARRERPALVVSDVMMPATDGFDLLRELRAADETRDVPIVLLSARAGEESLIEGLDAGADDYIVKPFTARQLLARVSGILELSHVRTRAANDARRHAERLERLAAASLALVEASTVDDVRGVLAASAADLADGARVDVQIDDVPSDARVDLPPGAIPLVAHDERVVGRIMCVPAGREMPTADRALLAQLARLGGLRLASIELFRREHTVAATLQRSLLPVLSRLEGVDVAARYVPGAADVGVGGDWYDIVELDDCTVVAIGDVVGHGLPAAAATSQIRHALRAYAFHVHAPGDLLARLNDLVLAVEDSHLSTAAVMTLDASHTGATLATAGHPPPLVVTPSGDTVFAQARPGTPLGALAGETYRELHVSLAPGTTVLLYTDGLVERRGESLDTGLDRLARASAGAATADLDTLVDELLETVAGPSHSDDIALLALRLGDRGTSPDRRAQAAGRRSRPR